MSIVITRQEKNYDFYHIFLLRSTYKIIPQYYETKKAAPIYRNGLNAWLRTKMRVNYSVILRYNKSFFNFLIKKEGT